MPCVGGLGGEQLIKLSFDALRERGQLASGRRRVSIGAVRPTDSSSLVNPTVPRASTSCRPCCASAGAARR